MPLFSPRHSVWVFPSVPPLCGGISMKTTSRYLIPSRVPLAPELKPQFDSPLPLSIKLSLSLSPPATFWFQSFSSGSTVCRSGCPNLTQLSAAPNCSHQIGTECGHDEWFTGRCWPQDSSSFTHGLLFFSPSLTSNCVVLQQYETLCLCYCSLIYVHGLLLWDDYSDFSTAVRWSSLKILRTLARGQQSYNF